MTKTRLGVLISGRGSNLQALLDACADSAFPGAIVSVISNEPDAYGLTRAAMAGIPALAIPHRAYKGKPEFEAALDHALRASAVELICLAGFMRLLSAGFVEGWAGRIINIHPSLLPKYRGLHTHERVLAEGDAVHGCTVHHVVAGMDEGPVILQATIPVYAGDTPETLAERLLPVEHRLYVDALRLVAEQCAGRKR